MERTGLRRLLTDLVSVWVDLDMPRAGVVSGENGERGVAGLPPVDPLALFGPALAAAAWPCPGCGSSTLLLLGILGGQHLFSYVHRGIRAAQLMPYHLAAEITEVPDQAVARPAGIVLGTIAGDLGEPVRVVRLLWAGEDGRPVGWSALPKARDGHPHPGLRAARASFLAFDRPADLGPRLRWLRLDPDERRDRELLRCRLAEDHDAPVVRRLHEAEGEALRDLELIS